MEKEIELISDWANQRVMSNRRVPHCGMNWKASKEGGECG